jgi:hypothetical protein
MKMLRILDFLLRCIFLYSIGGCANPDRDLTREVIRLPVEERGQALSKFPAEKQLDLYMYAYTRMEPPVILAGEVASNWQTTLPVIKARLSTERYDHSLAGLMMILSAISSQYCSLAKRDDVLAVASQAVNKIEPPYRDLANEQLNQLMHPGKQLPPCQ